MSEQPEVDVVLRRLFDSHPLESLTGAFPSGLFLTDASGVCVYTNERLQSICGFTAEQALGQGWTRAIHPDDRSRVFEDWSRATRQGRGEWLADFRVLLADGRERWVSARSAPTCTDGRVTGYVGTVEDISDRKALELAAARADERRRLLQSRFSSLVAASGLILRSPTVSAVLPATMAVAKDLIAADGYAVWRLHDGDDWRIAASEGISQAFADGSVPHRDTRPFFASGLTGPVFIEDVSVSGQLVNRRDAFAREGIRSLLVVPLLVTDIVRGTLALYYRQQRQADPVDMETASGLGNLAAVALATASLYDEQLLHRERTDRDRQRAAFLADAGTALASSLDYEETLRTVARLAVPDIADWCVVDMLDADGRAVRLAAAHADPALTADAMARSAEQPMDMSLDGGLQGVLRSGEPVLVSSISDEHLQRAADSPEQLARLRSLAPRSAIVAPLVTGGRVKGAISFVRTRESSPYDEDDFRFALAVAARAALAVDNAVAYAEVRAANRTKDEFLATLSHELRTPINAIMGWAQMLQHGIVQPERMNHAVEAIARNAAAQSRLVEDLLDVSRIITGKFRLDVTPVDIGAVIAAAVATVEPAAQAKGVTLAVSVDDGSSGVYGDRHRLQQAVWNLLANAVKFTPRDGRVEVDVRRIEGSVAIRVGDTGSGIPSHMLPYVFDRFRQADSSATRQHTGMGLGLAIVRHIVDMHGGTVEAHSEGTDRGATFLIRLPVNFVGHPSGQAAPARSTLTAVSMEPSALPDLAGIHVLLVDDDVDAQDMVAYVLRQRHAEVTVAGSVAEALEALDHVTPDVLLSDIQMPGQDGHALIAAIRDRPAAHGGNIPAAALTAHASPEDRARSLLAGYDTHLAKPVDLAELVATVVRLTTRPRARPA